MGMGNRPRLAFALQPAGALLGRLEHAIGVLAVLGKGQGRAGAELEPTVSGSPARHASLA